jgi:hypothetical protein
MPKSHHIHVNSAIDFMRLLSVACVLLLMCSASSSFAAPADTSDAATNKPVVEASPSPSQPSTPTPPAAPLAPAVNPVTQAAVQSGVLTCVSRINQVATFLTANCKSHAYLFVPQKMPDQSVFSVSLSTQTLDGVLKYSSASFAPTTGGQAAAVYDTVEYVAQPPDEVEKTTFKNLKRKGTLGKDIAILDGGPVTIFLMPAGPGCIVIKKEVVQ